MGFDTSYILNKKVPVELMSTNFENSNRMAVVVSEPKLLTLPTPDGTGQATHPSVVHIPKGFFGFKFWMGMTPYTNSLTEQENPCILASNDGITWAVPPGITNPIEPSPEGVAFNRDIEVVWDSYANRLRFYWGNSLGEGWFRDLSSSGVLSPKVQVIGNGADIPFGANQASVVKIASDKWVAFCQASGVNFGLGYTITRYTSNDGITWKRSGELITNMFAPLWHLGVTYTPEGFHFLISTHNPGAEKNSRELYYGFSVDGENVVFDSTPIVGRDNNYWFGQNVYKSHLIRWGIDKMRMYVSGMNSQNAWGIGYIDIKTNNPGLICNQFYGGIQPKTTTIFNDFAIRDTTVYLYSGKDAGTGGYVILPEFGTHQKKGLLVYSTLDQEITLQIRTNLKTTSMPLLNSDGTPMQIVIPANTKYMLIDESTIKALGMLVPASVTISVKATLSPTVGDLTVVMKSWKE